MARTEGQWEKKVGSSFIQTVRNVAGILLRGTNRYINFGSVTGDTGYGFRDNNGVLEYRNSSGAWTAMGAAEIAATFETVNKNISAYPYVINYTLSDDIDTIVYTTPSGSITKTFNYDGGGALASIVLSGSGLPSGLSILTKTLSYTTGQLTGVTYSA